MKDENSSGVIWRASLDAVVMNDSNKLPNALIIGPKKSGTSWIQEYMLYRGDVCLPTGVKETFFFDTHWNRGVSWYSRHFQCKNLNNSSVRLEIAPSYFHHIESPKRIHDTLGLIPLLVTLRDPVERAWSNYLHLRRYGHTNLPLIDAAEIFPEIIEGSRYKTCLERWYTFFPKKNIHFVWQEQLTKSPDIYAKMVCSAIGLEHIPVPKELYRRSNESAIPASHLLASSGSFFARKLRSIGMYGVVNSAKNMGLKRVFYGKPGSARNVNPTPDEESWLNEKLINEVPCEAKD